MASKSITMSPKYGVNPTIPVCFFCGEEKQEIALLGKLKGDVEAPHRMCLDYEPCEKCKQAFTQGILLVGVVTRPLPDNRPPIQENLYPTGSYMLVTESFIERFLADDVKTKEQVLKTRKMLLAEPVIQHLQKQAEALNQKEASAE
jgi:hypothetical protein